MFHYCCLYILLTFILLLLHFCLFFYTFFNLVFVVVFKPRLFSSNIQHLHTKLTEVLLTRCLLCLAFYIFKVWICLTIHVYRTYAFINQCSKSPKMVKLLSHVIIKSSKGEYFALLTLNVALLKFMDYILDIQKVVVTLLNYYYIQLECKLVKI